MKLGIALTLVMAFPTVAAAQYGFQLRPSPYRILSGWEQSLNAHGRTVQRVTRAATPVSDHTQAGRIGIQHNVRDGGGLDGAYGPAPHY